MSTATLRQWGGSVALPIPRQLLTLARLDVGQEVELQVQDGRIVIEAAKPQYTLAQLRKEHKSLQLTQDHEWLDFEDLPSERV